MAKSIYGAVLSVSCLTAALAAQETSAIIGTWETLDRHVAIGSLYQPIHGVRKRDGLVRFFQENGRLTGYAVHEGYDEIVPVRGRWKDGRTDFRKVSFEGETLSLEWEMVQWSSAAGPIAVENHQLENNGTIRVEARFQGQRLVGTWKMFLADGTEVFRGEWEAQRLIPGPVLLIGGRHQDLTDEIKRLFVARAGGGQARIVVLPTGVADQVLENREQFCEPWLELKPWSVKVLHTRDSKQANEAEFVKPLTEATAVFITNGHRDRILDAYRGTLVETELKTLHARGKLIAGAGTGAAVLAELVINREGSESLTEKGLGILPGFLTEDQNNLARFTAGIKAHPAGIALMIEPGAAALIHNQKLRALGTGSVTLSLPQAAEPKILPAGDEATLPAAATQSEGANRQAAAPQPVVRDEVTGSINHYPGTRWTRVRGQVKVLDARTLEFTDGTRIELDLTVPEPEQMAHNGAALYSCGREAADYLRQLTASQTVTCFQNAGSKGGGPWMAYVGDTNLERAMIVGGWALADHSSLHADEILARENRRGLWRGKFIHPDKWLAGERLPGEPRPR